MENKIKIVFIIPYRNRVEHKHFFERYMKYILEDYDTESYKIFYIQQDDERPFNRGAIKNIGFLYVKHLYPNNYKNITLVFNDVDTVPYCKNILNYETELGKIKHFFGFKFALGGIFSIKGSDFEKIDGFPNYWQWGFEDNIIYKRAIKNDIEVDRDNFYKIGNHNILHFCDSFKKGIDSKVLENQFDRSYEETDGISKLQNVMFKKNNDNESIVHVTNFETYYSYNDNKIINFSLLNGTTIENPKYKNRQKTLLFL